MPRIRINKFFTEQGWCSRRAADRLIEEGRVLINRRPAVLGDHVTDQDVVTVDGQVIPRERKTVYLAYHKPVGVTCTTEPDVEGNIIKAIGYPQRIFPIGRLDKDSSGLILLTNHGDSVNRILRSEYGHEREYRVTVDRPVPVSMLQQLNRGVVVLGKRTNPCSTTRIDATTFGIILTEGRNRQIRRMCAALGFRVVQLVRLRIMHIRLGKLPLGRWRYLTDSECALLLEAIGFGSERSSPTASALHRQAG